MAGYRGPGGASRDDGSSRDFLDDLKGRVVIALLAVIAGGGGAVGYMNVNPPRPDPFTGNMGRELESRTIDRDTVIWRQINAILDHDKELRAKLEAHLQRGEAGFSKLDQHERDMQEMRARLRELERAMK